MPGGVRAAPLGLSPGLVTWARMCCPTCASVSSFVKRARALLSPGTVALTHVFVWSTQRSVDEGGLSCPGGTSEGNSVPSHGGARPATPHTLGAPLHGVGHSFPGKAGTPACPPGCCWAAPFGIRVSNVLWGSAQRCAPVMTSL